MLVPLMMNPYGDTARPMLRRQFVHLVDGPWCWLLKIQIVIVCCLSVRNLRMKRYIYPTPANEVLVKILIFGLN